MRKFTLIMVALLFVAGIAYVRTRPEVEPPAGPPQASITRVGRPHVKRTSAKTDMERLRSRLKRLPVRVEEVDDRPQTGSGVPRDTPGSVDGPNRATK